MRLLYSTLMYLATPLVLAHLAIRGLRDSGYLRGWGERFALRGPATENGSIVIHGASVGEVNAAGPVVRALLREMPEMPLLVTCFTPTGSRRVRESFGKQVQHAFIPLDLPGAVSRFFRRGRPRLLLVMETEVWPNLFAAARRDGIPLILANARLSETSERRYKRLGGLIPEALGTAWRILAQSREDADRFLACGADPSRVEVAGNLKFDVSVPASHLEAGELLRTAWNANRQVLTAGSTHEADETELLEAFRACLEQYPQALLVIAPRHPERFARAAKLASQVGLTVARLSEGAVPPPDVQCLVVDTMGELLNYYAAADVTFLGGTLAEVGGHNILEPAALGKPVLVGPHTGNIQESCLSLIEAGAALQVDGSEELATALLRLFGNATLRDQMGRAALARVADGRGALDRTLAAIRAALAASQA